MNNIILEATPNSSHYQSPAANHLPTPKATPTYFFYQLLILMALVLFAIVFPAAGTI